MPFHKHDIFACLFFRFVIFFFVAQEVEDGTTRVESTRRRQRQRQKGRPVKVLIYLTSSQQQEKEKKPDVTPTGGNGKKKQRGPSAAAKIPTGYLLSDSLHCLLNNF